MTPEIRSALLQLPATLAAPPALTLLPAPARAGVATRVQLAAHAMRRSCHVLDIGAAPPALVAQMVGNLGATPGVVVVGDLDAVSPEDAPALVALLRQVAATHHVVCTGPITPALLAVAGAPTPSARGSAPPPPAAPPGPRPEPRPARRIR